MLPEKDHLDGEITLEASLTESGIKASAKSRFIVALDRMFGGIFDIPTAMMEGYAARKRLEDKLKRDAIEQRQELDLSGELTTKRIEQAAMHAAQATQVRSALNKAAIAAIALEDLSENAGSTSQTDDPLDEDWINVFGGYAENASSERLRQLWGKILAGEIRKPGSFSLTTLRVISELDQQTAMLFQKHATAIFDGNLIVKKGNPKGQTLFELTFLEEVGLLQEASGTLGSDQAFNEEGNYTLVNKNIVLVAKRSGPHTFRIDLIRISRAGQEIMSILPPESPDIVLREIANRILEFSDSILIGLILQHYPDGRINYQIIETIK